jgi:hypothetical protein
LATRKAVRRQHEGNLKERGARFHKRRQEGIDGADLNKQRETTK